MAKKKTQKQKELELKEMDKKVEDESKAMAKEDEAAALEADEAGDDEVDQDGQHDDEEQDIELIKKMLKDYLGDEGEGMEDEAKEAMAGLAKEAYEGHKEMGKKEDEAYKCAGEAIKLAHHMAKKQAEAKQAESSDEGDDGDKKAAPVAKDKKAAPASKDVPDDEGDDDESECKKESNREQQLERELLEAKGRLAVLEAKSKKAEITEYVESMLKKSGQPNSITKRFVEAAGDIRTKKEFDSKWRVFMEGAKHSRVELDWSALSEKGAAKEAKTETKDTRKLDFSVCAE